MDIDASEDQFNTTCMDHSIMQQLYTNSWVSQEYIPNVLNIVSGSAAGTPLADLVYGMCMARVLSLLRSSMHSDNLVSEIVIGSKRFEVNDVSFVDDVAMPIISEAKNLTAKIGAVADCAYGVFSSFGMALNFNPGKSEATVGLFGHDSRQARKHLFLAGNKIPISAGNFKSLNVVKCYQHVGTLSTISCDPREEVTKRIGIMRSDSRALCKRIMKVPSVPLKKKITVMQSFILTRGIFQCGTWPSISDVQYKRLHAAILKIYRDATGNSYKRDTLNPTGCDFDVTTMFNDDDVIYKYGFICPRTMLRLSRLSLFLRIIIKGPPLLLELILAQDTSGFKKGWVCSLRDDLVWLTSCEHFADGIDRDLAQWVEFLSQSPGPFLKKIKSFCKTPFANICTQWATSRVLEEYSRPVNCYLCGKESMSLQAHSVHLARSHGIKSKFRMYVDGPTCRICLVNFGSRERCLNHVRYRSKVCYANSLMRGPILSSQQADELDLLERPEHKALYSAGKRRHTAEHPCLRAHGPLLPILTLRGSSHHPLGLGYNYF